MTPARCDIKKTYSEIESGASCHQCSENSVALRPEKDGNVTTKREHGMKFSTALIALIPAIFLASCGDDPKSATEGNFKKAINEHYAKKCSIPLYTSFMGFDKKLPMTMDLDLEEIILRPENANLTYLKRQRDLIHSTAKQWDALVAVGLLEAKDSTRTVNSSGKDFQIPQRTYTLTEKGKSFLFEDTNFCIGRKRVTSIENFTEPAEAPIIGGMKLSQVVFKTSPADVADWAKNSAVQEAWPDLKDALQPNKTGHIVLIQTNKGWMEEHDFELMH